MVTLGGSTLSRYTWICCSNNSQDGMLTTLALVNTSSYAAALERAGMLETVSGLIRLQFWNFWPNRCSAL